MTYSVTRHRTDVKPFESKEAAQAAYDEFAELVAKPHLNIIGDFRDYRGEGWFVAITIGGMARGWLDKDRTFENSGTAKALRMLNACRLFEMELRAEGDHTNANLIDQLIRLPLSSLETLARAFEATGHKV